MQRVHGPQQACCAWPRGRWPCRRTAAWARAHVPHTWCILCQAGGNGLDVVTRLGRRHVCRLPADGHTQGRSAELAQQHFAAGASKQRSAPTQCGQHRVHYLVRTAAAQCWGHAQEPMRPGGANSSGFTARSSSGFTARSSTTYPCSPCAFYETSAVVRCLNFQDAPSCTETMQPTGRSAMRSPRRLPTHAACAACTTQAHVVPMSVFVQTSEGRSRRPGFWVSSHCSSCRSAASREPCTPTLQPGFPLLLLRTASGT